MVREMQREQRLVHVHISMLMLREGQLLEQILASMLDRAQ